MLNMLNNPLEQFDVVILYTLYNNFSITNFSVMLMINFIIVLTLIGNFDTIFKINNFLFFINFLFQFIKNILKDNLFAKKYSFIFIFYFLFLLILISNLLGMIPYSITVTSHFIFTFYYALSFFLGINLIGILYHKEKYFVLFLPDGVPVAIIPFLILIEYVSYFSRVLSLSIRLFANMMSGHILMKILIGFIWTMLSIGSIWLVIAFFPFIIVFCVTGLEFAIAFLQAYVFIVLLSIYLNDVINVH